MGTFSGDGGFLVDSAPGAVTTRFPLWARGLLKAAGRFPGDALRGEANRGAFAEGGVFVGSVIFELVDLLLQKIWGGFGRNSL